MTAPAKTNPLHRALFIFLFTLAVLLFYSFGNAYLSYGDFQLRKIPIPGKGTVLLKNFLVPKKTKDSVAVVLPKTDTTAQRFLVIGDSQLDHLLPAINDYCTANGDTIVASVTWYGSTTKSWGSCDTLSYFIQKYQPTCILVALGLNEVIVGDAAERGPFVQHILEEAGKTKLLWIGPACWKKDSGINDLLESSLGENQFFRTGEMKLERCKDGCHPTKDGSYVWMDSIAVWMQEKSCYRFRMKKPVEKKSKHMGVNILLH